MNPSQILTIAAHVFREVIRERALYLIGLFAFLMAAGTRLLPEIAATTDQKMLLDLGLAGITILGLIVSIFVGTALISKEIEKRTIYTLIAKPVSRADFILGKHLGLSAVLAVLVGSMSLVYFSILTLSRVNYPIGGLTIALLYILLELCLLAAVAITFSVFTGSLLSTLISFAVYTIGHFSQDLVSFGNLTKSPELKALTRNIYLVLPDLSRLNLKNAAIYGILPDSTTLLINAGYGFLYIILLLAIATLIFSQREF